MTERVALLIVDVVLWVAVCVAVFVDSWERAIFFLLLLVVGRLGDILRALR